jgi:hypothetical protein
MKNEINQGGLAQNQEWVEVQVIEWVAAKDRLVPLVLM